MNARPGPVAVVFVLVVAPQRRHGTQTYGVGEEDLGARVDPHLWVFEAIEVGVKVELDAFGCTGQSHSADQ